MAFTLSIETVVRGYHMYKEVWNTAMDGTELPCEREIGNANDPFAIAIKKVIPTTGNVSVGHTPRVISSVCSVFIYRGGIIVCVVNGARQYSSDLPWHLLTIQLTMAYSHSMIHWDRVTMVAEKGQPLWRPPMKPLWQPIS